MNLAIRHVVVWSNGMVTVFDLDGEQVPEYQGRLFDVQAAILRDAPKSAFFEGGLWASRTAANGSAKPPLRMTKSDVFIVIFGYDIDDIDDIFPMPGGGFVVNVVNVVTLAGEPALGGSSSCPWLLGPHTHVSTGH